MLMQPEEKTIQAMTDFGRSFGLAFQLADDMIDQDAIVKRSVDLRPLTHKYIALAKSQISSSNGNLYARHLIALCDLLTSK